MAWYDTIYFFMGIDRRGLFRNCSQEIIFNQPDVISFFAQSLDINQFIPISSCNIALNDHRVRIVLHSFGYCF